MSYVDAKAIADDLKATWHQLKANLEDGRDKNGDAIRRLNDRLDRLETSLSRPMLPGMQPLGQYDPDKTPNQDVRLFFKMVAARGPDGLRDPSERSQAERLRSAIETKAKTEYPEEFKALYLGDDAGGGFLAPPEFDAEVIKGVQLISPIRQIARVRPTNNRSVQVPVRSGVFAASWVGEAQTRTETTGLAYSLEDIPVNEMYAYVMVSQQDLEDSAFDLQAEIAAEAAEQFAKAEGTAFVNGDKVKKPEGFMVNAAVAHEPGGDASNLTGDGLISFLYSLKESYARNATWVMNRKTIGKVRMLKDGTTNVYLWAPGIAAGAPNTILGLPYIECPDMADVSGGAFPIALGDFRRGYIIVDRISIMVQRLVEKFAEQGQIAFLIRKRIGGQVVLPEAIKKLEIAAS